MHNPSDPIRADSLHRLGKELSVWVSPVLCPRRASLTLRSKLFGEDDEAEDETELEKAKADGENGKPGFG